MTSPSSDSSNPPASSKSQHAHGDRRLAGRRILVADDDLISREIAVRMLENLGCEVHAADNGQEVVDLHAAGRYDLVLMDCEMPVLDGFQAAQSIRAQENMHRHTPIIALTAATAVAEQEKCLASGMDDVISKPLRPQFLEDMLHRWLGTSDGTLPLAGGKDELEAVRDTFGADFGQLAALYLRDSTQRMEVLRASAASHDLAQTIQVAHAFAGSSASIGASGMSAMCRELELQARSGSVREWESKLDAMAAELDRISKKLEAMLG